MFRDSFRDLHTKSALNITPPQNFPKMRARSSKNAGTVGKIKIPNNRKAAVWDFLLVPGAAFEYSKYY